MNSKKFLKPSLKRGFVLCLLSFLLIIPISLSTPPKKTEFYKGEFFISDEPALNRTVELIFSIETIYDAPNTTIKLILPQEIELINATAIWNGDLKKNEKTELKFFLKAVEEGEWRITTYVENEEFRGFNRVFFFNFKTSQKINQIYYLIFLISIILITIIIFLKRNRTKRK